MNETRTNGGGQAVATTDEFEKLLSKPHFDAARRIDEIASRAERFFANGSFAAEIAIANTISELRKLLTPEVMQPIMALMNTDIGFATDRDPKKSKDPVQPYSVEVVKECFIESVMRGFRSVGNEWNIIAGRFYGCKNGFNRKVRSFPGVSEFKDVFEVPRLTSAGDGAIVKCNASWKLNGVADSVSREFPVRVNKFMGADAILGKAARKLLKAAHDQLTGTDTPDGEVDETIVPTPQAVTSKPSFTVEKPAKEPLTIDSARAELSAFLEPVPFDDFRGWLVTTGIYPEGDSLATMDDLPLEVVKKLLADPKTLGKCVKIFGGKEVAK